MKRYLTGQAQMLQIFIGEDDLWGTEVLYEAIIRKLRMLGVIGASAHRGLMGFGQQQRIHKSGRLGLSTELPVTITVIDTPEHIQRVLPVIDEMIADGGLVVLSTVQVIKHE